MALRVAPFVEPPPIRSLTVVRGLRFACALVTNRPEIVLLARVPVLFLGIVISFLRLPFTLLERLFRQQLKPLMLDLKLRMRSSLHYASECRVHCEP